MEDKYTIAVYSENFKLLESTLGQNYKLLYLYNFESLKDNISPDLKLIIMDFSKGSDEDLDLVEKIKLAGAGDKIPIVVLYGENSTCSSISAFKKGCDDFIDLKTDDKEIALRCENLIYHKIATDQLQVQVQQANEMAFIAMSDTSDLGVNIQFLLDVNNCDNLDEIGMRLLQALNSYGIKASLQLRSEYGIKNMERSGMAKELESILLWEMREGGRYVDFGKRSVMNYEQVSLLVKNMPVDDPKKYGAIKDNVFSLLQGADARVKALDRMQEIEDQQTMMRSLTQRMQQNMEAIDSGYQEVMKDIAGVVENMADSLNAVIINLALHEEQEKALENIIEYGIQNTTRVFASGLKLDESFKDIVDQIGQFLSDESVHINAEQRVKLMALLNQESSH